MMKVRENWFPFLKSLLLVVGGNILYALAVKLFLLPADLMTGGTTGIALVVNHLTGVSISMFVLVFNVCMLAAGFFMLGKQFALTTVVSTFTYPAALEFFDRMLGDMMLTSDPLLCALFSGLGIGASLGIVIRAGASTGGMDIPPLVLNRYLKIPVSVSLYVFDLCILLAQAFYNVPEKVLYGILLVLVYTIVLDKLILMGSVKTQVKIISRQPEKIRESILHQMDRGVTVLQAEGGYLHENTPVILSVISNRELPYVERLVRAVDPEAFMIVSRVTEVRGRCFSMKKEYR